jgi:hypothetical protein
MELYVVLTDNNYKVGHKKLQG